MANMYSSIVAARPAVDFLLRYARRRVRHRTARSEGNVHAESKEARRDGERLGGLLRLSGAVDCCAITSKTS